jgi:hypothetical protein
MTINQSKAEEQQRVNSVAKKLTKKLSVSMKVSPQAHQETHRIERNYGENTKLIRLKSMTKWKPMLQFNNKNNWLL